MIEKEMGNRGSKLKNELVATQQFFIKRATSRW